MYLAKMGKDLIEKGYQILPIKPNEKRPKDYGWTTKDYDIPWLDRAILNGCADCGVGVKTKFNPAVDIDTDIEELQEKLLDYLFDEYKADYTRYGRRPLSMFRTDVAFKKMSSAKYFDEKGGKHQIEILADGQQFVLGGIHPDTKTEYSIVGDYIPPVNELPFMTAEDALKIIEYAESLFDSYPGLVKSENKGAVLNENRSLNGPDKLPLVLADWQIDEYIKGCGLDVNDYDDWVKVGMCLYHQFMGSNQGLLIWDGWSQAGVKYNADEMLNKWNSFKSDNKGLTFRTIIKLHNELNKKISKTSRDKCKEELNTAESGQAIIDEILPKYKGVFSDVEKEDIAQLAKVKFKELEGYPQSIANIRFILSEQQRELERDLSWAKDYIYLEDEHMMFNIVKNDVVKIPAFNTKFYNRTEQGEGSPADFMVSNNHIPILDNYMYAPHEQGTFFMDAKEYYNTYKEYYIKKTPYSKHAVNLFINHCERLIPDKRDRLLFLSFLSHIVKNNGRITWAVLLEGPEGNGKSFFENIMRAILGKVNPVTNQILKSDFNDWCMGTTFNVLSELKITGVERYTVYNNIKPYITDDIINLHPKGRRTRAIKNTASYLITTNYKNAAPINDKDRRLMPIFTNPEIPEEEYFNELFDTCLKEIWSVKQYLLNFKSHKDFNPRGRAPRTAHHAEMVKINRSPIELVIDEAIDDKSNIFITEDFVSIGAIKTELEVQDYGKFTPNKITNKLHEIDYVSVKRLKFNGELHSFWTKNNTNETEIKNYLDNFRT